MRKLLAAAVLAALTALILPASAPVAVADDHKDHLIDGFDKPVLRAFDPVKRVPVKKVRVQDILKEQKANGTVVKLRAVDDLVCLKLTGGDGREEACVLSADLSPCVCDYEVADVAQKGSDIGGLSGVVSPNGGTCSCK